MQEFLHSVWRRTGLTALLITHDIEEALRLQPPFLALREDLASCLRGLDSALSP
jgi:NitT/TauT family transport system ATP-binding protein